MLGLVLSVTSMILYVAETGLQIHLATNRINTDFTSFVIIVSLVGGPLVIVNIISTVLVLRTMDFTGRGCARIICILLHFLQVGLLWRCLKLVLLFDEHDWREFIILRLIHTALQSFPIVVLKGSHLFSGEDMTSEVIVLVITAIVANGVVFSMFNTEKYLFENDEFSELNVRIRKPFGVLILTFGTIFLLFSRCGSIMQFVAIVRFWIPLPLGFHFIVYLFSSVIYRFYKKQGSILQFTKDVCLSYFNIFDILNKENQNITCCNVLLYSGILVQNVFMTGYWMMNNDWDYKYQLGSVVSIILTFLCGMFLKCCSCSYLENDKFEPFSDATFQLALEIASKNTTELIAVRNENHGEIQNHEQYGEYENQRSIYSLENGYIHKVSQPKTRNSNTKNMGNKKTQKEKSLEINDSTPSRVKGTKPSGSNVDLASSNSRNTNTLNISDPSNVCNQSTAVKHLNGAQTMPCLTVRKRPELTVRTSDRKPNTRKTDYNTNVETKLSFCKSPPKNRKSPLPLFPNECSNFVSNKTFESKHVLSNSADEYSETDSSYSEYASYSYYADSTDWSTMSCESACTWPPSNIVTFINLHSLPTEKISSTDSVQLWLAHLDEWEPSLENESFDLTLKDKCSSPVPSSERSQNSKYKQISNQINDELPSHRSSDISHNSKSKQLSKENQNSDQLSQRKGESDILLRPKDAMIQFCKIQRNENKMSYLPYEPSNCNKPTSSGDNTIVIWHDRETVTSNTIQESMV